MAAATSVFFTNGIEPRRIAEGDRWYINEWSAGVMDNIRGHNFRNSTGRSGTVEEWAKIGRLLAKVHLLPCDWFESARQEIISAYPRIADVPHASHIWGYFSNIQNPLKMFVPLIEKGNNQQEDLLKAYLELGTLVCTHPITARVVTQPTAIFTTVISSTLPEVYNASTSRRRA